MGGGGSSAFKSSILRKMPDFESSVFFYNPKQYQAQGVGFLGLLRRPGFFLGFGHFRIESKVILKFLKKLKTNCHTICDLQSIIKINLA